LNKKNCPAVLGVHPWELDPGQPAMPVKGLSKIRHYWNIKRMRDRLVMILERFNFGTVKRCINSMNPNDF
jgi:hypothetical protein